MLLEIFKTFFKVGAFTIGGGYAMIPVIQKEVVEKKNWLKNEEFLDSIAVTNSLPGPIAINCATFVGYKTAGVPGAITAALGAVMPSFIIILTIAIFFKDLSGSPIVENIFAGIRPGVVALIAYALVKLAKSAGINKLNMTIGIIAMLLVLFVKLHPIFIVIIAGFTGLVIFRKRGEA
jgi:chromate transporter